MGDPLQPLRQVMLLSGITAAVLLALLLLMTRGREWWRRLLDTEESLWKRVGFRRTGTLRRFEESRGFVIIVGLLLLLHLGLLLFAAGAYLHYAPRLRKHTPPPTPPAMPHRVSPPPPAPHPAPAKPAPRTR